MNESLQSGNTFIHNSTKSKFSTYKTLENSNGKRTSTIINSYFSPTPTHTPIHTHTPTHTNMKKTNTKQLPCKCNQCHQPKPKPISVTKSIPPKTKPKSILKPKPKSTRIIPRIIPRIISKVVSKTKINTDQENKEENKEKTIETQTITENSNVNEKFIIIEENTTIMLDKQTQTNPSEPRGIRCNELWERIDELTEEVHNLRHQLNRSNEQLKFKNTYSMSTDLRQNIETLIEYTLEDHQTNNTFSSETESDLDENDESVNNDIMTKFLNTTD